MFHLKCFTLNVSLKNVSLKIPHSKMSQSVRMSYFNEVSVYWEKSSHPGSGRSSDGGLCNSGLGTISWLTISPKSLARNMLKIVISLGRTPKSSIRIGVSYASSPQLSLKLEGKRARGIGTRTVTGGSTTLAFRPSHQ